VVCADHDVIFGSNDGFVYAVTLADGTEVWRYEIGAPVKAPPAVAGDWILIGSDDGSVYAFKNGKSK
jgi:outer membrane protein assembly factor BamB